MVIPYAGICAGGEPSRNAEARPYRDSTMRGAFSSTLA
jgi:hypothetical protein